MSTEEALGSQLELIDGPVSTRARAWDLVARLRSRQLQVGRALMCPEGGITLHVAGARPDSYASIDVCDDGDVVIGVGDTIKTLIVDTTYLEAALDVVAGFLALPNAPRPCDLAEVERLRRDMMRTKHAAQHEIRRDFQHRWGLFYRCPICGWQLSGDQSNWCTTCGVVNGGRMHRYSEPPADFFEHAE